MEPENEDSKIECIVCQRKFKRRSALYRHLRGVHKLTVEFAGRKYKFKCPDPGCSVTFHLSEKLRNHITEVHGVQIELCVKWFNSFSGIPIFHLIFFIYPFVFTCILFVALL